MKIVEKFTLPRVIKGLHELMELQSSELVEEFSNAAQGSSKYLMFIDNACNKSWAGVQGIAEYTEQLISGTGSPKLINEHSLVVNQEGKANHFVPNVCGVFNDPVAYIEGQPECMFDFEQAPVNNYVRVMYAAIVSASIELKKCEIAAKAISECVNILEVGGTRVRIEVLFVNQHEPEINSFKVIIKDYEENYIPHVHGFAMGNFGTVRAAGYSYWERINSHEGLGQPFRDFDQIKTACEKYFGTTDKDILVSTMMEPAEIRKKILG